MYVAALISKLPTETNTNENVMKIYLPLNVNKNCGLRFIVLDLYKNWITFHVYIFSYFYFQKSE